MNKDRVNRELFRLLVLVFAIAFCSMAHAQRVNHNIELRLNETATMLDITTKGNCANANHPGCIDVARGTTARFNFSFVGNRSCNLASGSSWVAGEVYLGGKNSVDKPGSWGGFENDAQVQADFNFVDAATGLLAKEAGSNQNSIVIFDDNMSANGYDIWYMVTADCVDSGGNVLGQVETDPRIKNGGTE